MTSNQDLKAHIIKKLQGFDIRGDKKFHENCSPPFRTAAVLLPLKICNGEIYILLTKRAKWLRSHASETSFPGGMVEESDSSVVEAALREAEEETGLLSSDVEVLAVLTKGMTSRKTIVFPVVGLIPSDFQPNINPSEVEFAFFMPLKDFLCDEKVDVSIFHVKFAYYVNRTVIYKNGEEAVNVWGFTSLFCTFLAKIVLGNPDYLETHVGCPNTGRIDDCIAEYFRLFYNFTLAESCSKL